MLKTFWTILIVWLCALTGSVPAAETYGLADGTSVTGDILTYNGSGVKFRLTEDKYSDVIQWTQFSQAGLQTLAKNPKVRPLVEPFMELPPVAKVHSTDNIQVRDVTRLERPARQSLLGALAASSVGKFLLFLIYLANLYAAFEVANCRARPLPVVMGLSAVLPYVGPAIFYFLPTNLQTEPTMSEVAAEAQAPVATGENPAAPQAPALAETPSLEGIQIAAISAAASQAPADQVYKRGQFTFNRRFVETKFAGFIAPVRSAADQKLDFMVKLPQGVFLVQRISNVGMNDVRFEVLQDGQPQEVLAPFADILEITIKAKTA